MFRAFFLTRRWLWWSWGILFLLIFMTVVQTYITVLFNAWNREVYDAIQNKDYATFVGNFQIILFKHAWTVPSFTMEASPRWFGLIIHGIWGFSILAFLFIIIATYAVFIARHYTFRWRQAITFYYLPYYAKIEKDSYEGSSQRLQQDTQMLASGAYSLGLGGMQSIMSLVAFIPILWGLGQNITLWGMKIPGLLLWLALAASVGGIIISIWVGRKLPQLEYNNQKVEAAYRKQLVLAEDDKQYADQFTIGALFKDLRKNYFVLFSQFKYFSLWQNFYGQCMVILPFIAVAPNFFIGTITLGVFMQIISAFGTVQGSLSFFLDNWTAIVELRAVIRRLKEFESSIKV